MTVRLYKFHQEYSDQKQLPQVPDGYFDHWYVDRPVANKSNLASVISCRVALRVILIAKEL